MIRELNRFLQKALKSSQFVELSLEIKAISLDLYCRSNGFEERELQKLVCWLLFLPSETISRKGDFQLSP